MNDSSETDPDIIRATHRDPTNVILQVEKQTDLGVATSSVNPGLSMSSAGGWVSTSTNETIVVPGAYSQDPAYTSVDSSSGGGLTGGDVTPIQIGGGYHKKYDDPAYDDGAGGVFDPKIIQ